MSTPESQKKPRVRMITPVWGASYIDRWLDLCFASLRRDVSQLNRYRK